MVCVTAKDGWRKKEGNFIQGYRKPPEKGGYYSSAHIECVTVKVRWGRKGLTYIPHCSIVKNKSGF